MNCAFSYHTAGSEGAVSVNIGLWAVLKRTAAGDLDIESDPSFHRHVYNEESRFRVAVSPEIQAF